MARYRRAGRQSRFSFVPMALIALAGLSLLAVLYVALRMMMAGRPTVALGEPFVSVTDLEKSDGRDVVDVWGAMGHGIQL